MNLEKDKIAITKLNVSKFLNNEELHPVRYLKIVQPYLHIFEQLSTLQSIKLSLIFVIYG